MIADAHTEYDKSGGGVISHVNKRDPTWLETLLSHDTILNSVFSWSLGGACLIHTVAGDLLRSLDPRSPDMSPRLMSIASEEGVILVTFDKGHVCSYTINGKFLIQTDVNGKVNVSDTKSVIELE